MALQTRTIRTKIRSVGNIKKITRAMEMVAVSKMKRAVSAAFGTREYTAYALSILSDIAKEREAAHPFLDEGVGEKTLMIIIASDKGLCGGFNVQLGKHVAQTVSKLGGVEKVDFVTIGRNAEKIARRVGSGIRGSFSAFDEQVTARDIGGLMRLVFDDYRSDTYKAVVLAYNHYRSAISYLPITRDLLPVDPAELHERFTATLEPDDKAAAALSERRDRALYLFEPDEEEVLLEILPRLVEVQVYQAILESAASEHSARMFAMKNATDNAEKLVDELTLRYNHARQDGITQEISEIAAGADALTG